MPSLFESKHLPLLGLSVKCMAIKILDTLHSLVLCAHIIQESWPLILLNLVCRQLEEVQNHIFFYLFSLIFFISQGPNFLCHRASHKLQKQGKRNICFQESSVIRDTLLAYCKILSFLSFKLLNTLRPNEKALSLYQTAACTVLNGWPIFMNY